MPINEANLTMDEAQSLMMALCFTHQIVNQAISIPEPIYQADEWAKRGRNNFRAMLLVIWLHFEVLELFVFEFCQREFRFGRD